MRLRENADNERMNSVNFEDTIFILNLRIRMIRDTLRLSPPPELFMEKSMDDLVFVDQVLGSLTRILTENGELNGGNDEFDYASDTEWQFSQLLTEFMRESNPFSVHAFPAIMEKITALRNSSDTRRKALDEYGAPAELVRSEPVVSSAELCGLLGPFLAPGV